MKFSDIRGVRALEVTAEIIAPASTIMKDEQVADLFRDKKIADAVTMILRKYAVQTIEIMAAIDGITPEEYEKKLTIATLPAKLIEFFSDSALMELFSSPSLNRESESSGSASAATAE